MYEHRPPDWTWIKKKESHKSWKKGEVTWEGHRCCLNGQESQSPPRTESVEG